MKLPSLNTCWVQQAMVEGNGKLKVSVSQDKTYTWFLTFKILNTVYRLHGNSDDNLSTKVEEVFKNSGFIPEWSVKPGGSKKLVPYPRLKIS